MYSEKPTAGDKSVTINGNNHTIDGNHQAQIFEINFHYLKIKRDIIPLEISDSFESV